MAQVHTRITATVPGPAEDPLIGRVIADRYRIVSLIAQGGMGRVYRAEQHPLNRSIALKVLSINGAAWETPTATPSTAGVTTSGSNQHAQRFMREAAISAQLKHPNTITIFDYGVTDDEVYYIAMELLEGRTLQQAIAQDGAFAPERAIRIAAQMCRSLREAHAQGVVHRDLKPGNIFLVRNDDDPDWVKVLDFGLGKGVGEQSQDLTQQGTFLGSPRYMSPEQIRTEDVDFRTDIYSLGVILYQMLTGKPPFAEASAIDTVVAHLQRPPPPMEVINPNVRVPEPIEATVLRCMAKKAQDRFASMDELLQGLKQAAQNSELSMSGSSPALSFLDGSGSSKSAPPAVDRSYVTSNPSTPRRGMTWVAATATLGCIAVIAAMWFSSNESTKSETEPSSPSVAGLDAQDMPSDETVKNAAPAHAKTVSKVRLTSNPEGASVSSGGELVCKVTPCDIELEANRKQRLTFSKKGYESKSIDEMIVGGSMQVSTELLKAGRSLKPRRVIRKPTRMTRTPAKKPRNTYKDNPY